VVEGAGDVALVEEGDDLVWDLLAFRKATRRLVVCTSGLEACDVLANCFDSTSTV
jgi:hypothetical protein